MKNNKTSEFNGCVEWCKSLSCKNHLSVQNIEDVFAILQKPELKMLIVKECNILLVHHFAENKAKEFFPEREASSVLLDVYKSLKLIRKDKLARLFSNVFNNAEAMPALYRGFNKKAAEKNADVVLNRLCKLIYNEDTVPQFKPRNITVLAFYILTFIVQCHYMVEISRFLWKVLSCLYKKLPIFCIGGFLFEY